MSTTAVGRPDFFLFFGPWRPAIFSGNLSLFTLLVASKILGAFVGRERKKSLAKAPSNVARSVPLGEGAAEANPGPIVAKELFRIAIAIPAAVGIIGQLDDKLHLAELLERIVTGYKVLSQAVWRPLLDRLPVEIILDADTLSVLALMFIPSAIFMYQTRNTTTKAIRATKLSGMWSNASLAGVCVTAAIFQSLTWNYAIMAYLIATFFILEFTWLQRGRNTVFVMLAATVAASLASTYVSHGGSQNLLAVVGIGIVRALVISAPVMITMSAVIRGFRTPAYILAVFGGVLGVNWLATDVLPVVDGLLRIEGI
ncbi:MAG: hypothetical protein IR164_03840 [Devosia sp.]|uniref:hypothetical protein n=1 Tax=Devosia sp. TaxID=1871048 RepID=UPI001A07EC23|nr:hypothetical protein [Devosia sp.]MBF0678056.1 hypothetical protein [Devosia sp.]